MSAAREGSQSAPPTQAAKVCSRHGDRETLLTCGRCGRPYCTDCLIHTPAGLRCHECAGVSRYAAEQATFGAVWQTVAITAAASAGTFIVGGWLFILLLAGIAGIAGATRWAPLVIRRTRTRTLVVMALSFFGGTILGPLVFALGLMLVQGDFAPGAALAIALGNPLLLLFTALATGIAWWRLR